MSTWQEWVQDLGTAMNTVTSVAGNIGSTVQSLQAGTYLNQQQISQQQQQQQTKQNNIFMYMIFGFLVLFLIFRH